MNLGVKPPAPVIPTLVAVPSEEEQDTATGNMYRKCGEIWTCGFVDMQMDRQTDRQTC